MGFNIVGDVVGAIVGPVKDLISEFITDKDKQNDIAFKLATMATENAHSELIANMDINKESAKHASVFVAGARPAAIWVGVFGLFLVLILFPLVTFIFGLWGHKVDSPELDMVSLFALLGPLLGLGGYRMVETLKGVQRDTLGAQPKGK